MTSEPPHTTLTQLTGLRPRQNHLAALGLVPRRLEGLEDLWYVLVGQHTQ